MKQLLRAGEPCCLCRVNPATETLMRNVDFMGRKFPVAAALCQGCYRRTDRDEILSAYIESIFRKH